MGERIPPKASGKFPSTRLRTVVRCPTSLAEFEQLLPDEDACARYLEQVRWAGGYACPHCGARGAPSRRLRGMLLCRACDRSFTPSTGTLLHGTRRPLRSWFRAIWEVAMRPTGSDAATLQAALRLRRKSDGWRILSRLRVAMARGNTLALGGIVEVGKIRVSVEEEVGGGRRLKRIHTIAVAAEVDHRAITRIRLFRLRHGHERALLRFVRRAVYPGTRIETCSWNGYTGLLDAGYDHMVRFSADEDGLAHAHEVVATLRLWLAALPELSPENLDHYLDEFTFRFNYRPRCPEEQGHLFYRLLLLVVQQYDITCTIAQAAG